MRRGKWFQISISWVINICVPVSCEESVFYRLGLTDVYIYEGSARQIEIMFSDWHNCKNRFYCGLIVFPSLSLLNSISGNCCEIGWLLEEFSTSLSSGTPGLCANVPVLVFFKHECEQTLTSTTLNSLITTIKHCLHLWLLLWKGSASGTWAIWPDLPVPGSYWFASILDNDDAILPVQLQKQQNASHQHFYQLCEVIREPPTPNHHTVCQLKFFWTPEIEGTIIHFNCAVV